jgi:hypothetical protein
VKLGEWQLETLQMNEKALFIQCEYDKITLNYEKIVNNCQKATEIDPASADAWHLYSQTNEEAMMHYSRLFSLEQKKKAEKLSGNKDFLLHREFGHFRLPKL